MAVDGISWMRLLSPIFYWVIVVLVIYTESVFDLSWIQYSETNFMVYSNERISYFLCVHISFWLFLSFQLSNKYLPSTRNSWSIICFWRAMFYLDAKGVGIDHDFMRVITFSIIRALNGLMIQILKMRNCDDFLIFVHQRKIKKRVS